VARMSSIDRRSELVQAALRVIARDGVAAATTRAIVGEAEMPLASFHYAFASRDELMSELIRYVLETQSGAVFASLTFGDDIRSNVHAGLRAYFATISADPSHELAMFELAQYALRTEGLEHLAAAQYESYRATCRDLLEAGAESARIRWTLPVSEVARIVVTLTDGITLAWLADRDSAAAARVIDFAADAISHLARPLKEAP
jgi:DNA-binding transcriptional regulator YbjK